MNTPVVIAFGGNLGNVPETIQGAIDLLQQTDGISVVRRSASYVTRAIGSNAGDDFINAAALLEVECSPLELLQHLQRIENELGRARSLHWGPRTLDLDLVRFGEKVEVIGGKGRGEREEFVFETRLAELILPHPACWYRRFVLDPWSELEDDWVHPLLQETVGQMQSRLLRRPLRVGVLQSGPAAEALMNLLESTFTEADVSLVATQLDRRLNYSSAPDDQLEMEFVLEESEHLEPLSPRAILLSDENGKEMAVQNVRAALDHPQRLE